MNEKEINDAKLPKSSFNRRRQTQELEKVNGAYESGWNSALEMAAYRIQNDFKKSFGDDTLSSIAIYIREMKK